MKLRLDQVLERIISVNHAWKLSKEEFGAEFIATNALRDTKPSLLREFPDEIYLQLDANSDEHEEALYSARLSDKVPFNGVVREDPEHLFEDQQKHSTDFLQPMCSTINRKLKKALPTQTSGMLEVVSVSEGVSQRYSVALCCSDIEVSVTNKHFESEG